MRCVTPKRALGAAILMAASAVSSWAQPPDEPLESPLASVSQVVGTRPITISYFSPGVKERTIWDELVPYGQNWRAGANDKTVFTFSEDMVLGGEDGQKIAAGSYGFYILPKSASEWELVWNASSEGSPNEFDPALDVVRLIVQPEEAPMRERLQYSIENFSDWPPFTGEFVLHWERVRVVVEFEIVKEETRR